jgi:hypothetical protein
MNTQEFDDQSKTQVETPMDSFSQLLPLAYEWAEQQQDNILQNGTPLSESQMNDTKLVPVRFPEKVRLLKVERIPWPDNPTLLSIGQQMGLISDYTEGLTLGYGIFISSKRWQERRLVVHELAHVGQCEKLGGVNQFLEQYVEECLNLGYDDACLEIEARETVMRICGGQ